MKMVYKEIAEAIYAISTTDRGWKEPIQYEIDGPYEHKISYYQKHPGCKVQFSKAQLEKYLDRVEREARDARKRK